MTVSQSFLISAVLGLTTSAIATQPNVTSIDLGNDIGKKVSCEGRLYAAPAIYSLSAGENSTAICNDKDIVCANIIIEKCVAYKNIDSMQCAKVAFKKSAFDKLKSSALSPTDIDILEEMKKRGTSFKQNDGASRALYDKLLNEKIARKPLLRVSGNLYACTATAESYPSAQCRLSACTVEHVDPTLGR